ncbi:MAG: ATP synthase F1 subunit delta, partial [Planctomycetes bacterium]|nr:ATP synthase F1 subunit delta [Planctomycetota bacterium]
FELSRMLIEKIPALYGKALLEAAADADVLEDVAAEVSFVGGLLGEDADLRLFVESPSIESAQKREVFEKTFRGKATDTFVNFLLLLVDKGREAELAAILAAFGAFHDEHVGLVRAEVVSAEELAEEEIDKLAAAIGASIDKQVIVSNKVDPEMIGGVIVRYQGMVADGSLRTALKELRSEMLSPKFESELVHEN